MFRKLQAAFGLMLLFSIGHAEAQDRSIRRLVDTGRIALVIGNDTYSASPLANAVNDAREMARMLKELGFDVVVRYNADQRAFDTAVDEFVARLGPKDVALFYYAGHGVQIDTRNYLIPVDFTAKNAAAVKYKANPADLVRERMEGSGAALSILILDACRDNPFPATRSFSVGLSQMKTTVGTFIAFSTSPGRTAQDNPTGSNGLFTHHLLEALRVPGLSLDEVFNQVRTKVYMESAGRQVPWSASTVIGDFRFRPERVAESPAPAALPSPPPRTPVPPPPTLPFKPPPPATESRPSPRPASPASGPPGVFTLDTSRPFCLALEKVLGGCPNGFENLVESTATGSSEYLRPTVTLLGAWYAYVQRSDDAGSKFLASFSIGQEDDPSVLTSTISERVAACLSPQVIRSRQTIASGYRYDIAADTPCRIHVLTRPQDVDVEIVAERQ